MAACTPSVHVFLGSPLFLLSCGILSIINFGILSSGILLTCPYHCSLFFSMMSMMHNLSLVYLSMSTCFGRLCAHHQEKQLCLCDTCYLLFCVDDCLVCIIIIHYILRINCAPRWLYLQDYTRMHGQQSINL